MAKPEELPEADVLVRNVKKSFDDLLALNPHIGKDVVLSLIHISLSGKSIGAAVWGAI